MRSGRALLSSSPGAAAAAGSGGTVVLHQPSGRHLFGSPRAGATPQGLASSLDPAVLAAAARTPRASMKPTVSSRGGRAFLGVDEEEGEAEADERKHAPLVAASVPQELLPAGPHQHRDRHGNFLPLEDSEDAATLDALVVPQAQVPACSSGRYRAQAQLWTHQPREQHRAAPVRRVQHSSRAHFKKARYAAVRSSTGSGERLNERRKAKSVENLRSRPSKSMLYL